MKRLVLHTAVITVLLLTGFASSSYAQWYCKPKSDCTWYGINKFQFAAKSKTSTCSKNAYDSSTIDPSKAPFLDTIYPGKSYSYKITGGSFGNQEFGLFVDWNNDKDFKDAGEQIDTSKSGLSNFSGTLKVPIGIPSGLYRVRVRTIYSYPGWGPYLTKTDPSCHVSTAYNYGETEDYNVYVKNATANDAGVISVLSPANKSCGDSFTPVRVVVANFGINSISKIPVTIHLKPGSGSPVSLTDTIFKTLAPGTLDTFSFKKTLNTFNGVTYAITAYTEFGKDTTHFDDTLKTTSAILFGVENPYNNLKSKDSNVVRCAPGTVKLFVPAANLGYTAFWYNSLTASSRMAVGDTFVTPYLNTPAAYYVAYSTATIYNVGATDNSISTSGDYNAPTQLTNYELFTAKSNFTIDSVTVYTLGSGKIVVDLRDASGSSIQKVTVPVTGKGKHQIPVGINVIGGSNYGLSAYGSTIDLYRNKNITGSPTFSAAGVLDIYNNTATDKTRYYYFYNWIVTGPGCISNRIAVNLNVGKPFTTFSAGSPFKGTFAGGTSSNPDTISSGTANQFIINPPFAMTNADYGTKWTIKNLNFQTPSGTTSTDTTFVYPNAKTKTSGSFTFTPKASLADSIFVLSYKVTNALGCDSDISRYIYISSRPKAAYSYSGTCSGTGTQFTNASTLVKGNLSYMWDFGDGNTSNQSDPLHTYTNGGTYTVWLKAIASNGSVDSTSKTINLYEHPTAGFAVNKTCFFQNTEFTDKSTIPSGSITSYYYDFGDGSTAFAKDTTNLYASVAVYSVTHIVVSDKGCSDTIRKPVFIQDIPNPDFGTDTVCEGAATHFSNNTINNSGGTLTYFWKFGDGQTSTDSLPPHVYTSGGAFSTKLIATSNAGCADSITHTVNVYPKPATNFGVTGACVQQTTQFIDSTIVSVGNVTNYYWDFGDSTITYAKHPAHRYLMPGTYKVKLDQVTNYGCVNSRTKTITIGSMPDAGFRTQANGLDITFIPNDTSAATYTWDFGDSATSSARVANHQYAKDSVYIVSLTVTKGSGDCSSNTVSIKFSTATGIEETSALAAKVHVYPNPFREVMNITYSLDKAATVKADVYDLTGRLMANLGIEKQNVGEHTLQLNATKYSLRGGIYLLRLQIGDRIISRQIIMLK